MNFKPPSPPFLLNVYSIVQNSQKMAGIFSLVKGGSQAQNGIWSQASLISTLAPFRPFFALFKTKSYPHIIINQIG